MQNEIILVQHTESYLHNWNKLTHLNLYNALGFRSQIKFKFVLVLNFQVSVVIVSTTKIMLLLGVGI